MNTKEARKVVDYYNAQRYKLDRLCEISPVSSMAQRREEGIVKFGVNWFALGTTSTENTMKFIAQLAEASVICQNLNNENISAKEWEEY